MTDFARLKRAALAGGDPEAARAYCRELERRGELPQWEWLVAAADFQDFHEVYVGEYDILTSTGWITSPWYELAGEPRAVSMWIGGHVGEHRYSLENGPWAADHMRWYHEGTHYLWRDTPMGYEPPGIPF